MSNEKNRYSNISSAILRLDSNAEIIVENNDIKKITWLDDNPNSITEKQITDKQAELETEYDNNKAKEETDKTNANKKLKDLGLTDDEIKAIKGIK
mgnify:FL=1|jgi:hypothetical protein|tara:strand:+ start:884 stop:1171 length:288 start_codon:yes stop_codon:yes gene_type:complete